MSEIVGDLKLMLSLIAFKVSWDSNDRTLHFPLVVTESKTCSDEDVVDILAGGTTPA